MLAKLIWGKHLILVLLVCILTIIRYPGVNMDVKRDM
jgi:hypothetical protein